MDIKTLVKSNFGEDQGSGSNWRLCSLLACLAKREALKEEQITDFMFEEYSHLPLHGCYLTVFGSVVRTHTASSISLSTLESLMQCCKPLVPLAP